MTNEYDNIYEIRVWGLPRFGSHAIINWIVSLFDEQFWFFTKCRIRNKNVKNKSPMQANHSAFFDPDSFVQKYYVRSSSWYKHRFMKQHNRYLIYRFESQDIECSDLVSNSLGNSKYQFDVLILRDIWNWAASSILLKHNRENNWNPLTIPLDDPKFKKRINPEFRSDPYIKYISGRMYYIIQKYFPLYKQYAEEFVGLTNHLQYNNFIPISFNKWFVDLEYRKELAEMFGMKNNEDTLNCLSHSGSSFDETSLIENARNLKVLERWKEFEKSILFWDLLSKCPESVKFSEKIFGNLKTMGV